jgi:DNA ligase-associated metallophosphoesterase
MGNPSRRPFDADGDMLLLGGATLRADRTGAVYWPDEDTLIVADLHLEKSSSFATRGVMLPPYDTATTLGSLAEVILRHNPARVIALGDSFHDNDGGNRLTPENRAALAALQAGREWHWVSGNHDPEQIDGVGGIFSRGLRIGGLSFRHQPAGEENEVVGHFHPVASISARGRTMRLRCFAVSPGRMILPAFGSLTGGLDVRTSVFAEVLGLNFLAHVWAVDRFCSFSIQSAASA